MRVVSDENDPMDGRVVKRPFTFVNPKLSTKAAERRRKLARVLRHVALAIAAVVAVASEFFGSLAPALVRWADQLDKSAKRRQQKAARGVLNTWGAQETAEPPRRA